MDTDDLSQETYKAVILTAEMFNHDLTLHFGCLAMDCYDEEEYLLKSEQLIKECLEEEDIEILMDDLFFGNPPNIKDFKNVLSEIQYKINQVREIPLKQRTFDF
ncbi:hypothetical protein FACS189413_02510 [Bacteroidia bacterium]|nr:hypothetical protein FACS189413_02510 [Bacteroidia bacterium]